jgi:hypothetical protein
MKSEIILYIVLTIFIIGLIYIVLTSKNGLREGFNTNNNCPNLLIKKDGAYFLYNKNKSEVPGVNPIRFEHLEDYTEFIGWLRNQGIKCPILYLQQTYDTQGKRTFKMLPDTDNINNSLPTHNSDTVKPYDPLNQSIGKESSLNPIGSNIFQRDNPFSNEFEGEQQAESDVKSGYYKDDEVLVKSNN